MVTVEVFKKLKPWRLAAVAAVLAAAVTALFGAGAISGWSRPADAGVPGPAVQAQEPA
jgi:hypothetical protein